MIRIFRSRRTAGGGLIAGCCALLLAFGSPVSAAGPPSEWYQLGGYSGHTGYNAFESRLTTSTVPRLQAGWQEPGEQVRTPLVYGGQVYSVTQDRFLRTWSVAQGELGLVAVVPRCTDQAAPPVISQKVLMVPTTDCGRADSIQAYPAGDYHLLWQRDVPAGITSTSEKNGVLYVTGRRGSVTALDVVTGQVRWTVRSGMQALDDSAIGNGVLYVSGFRTVQARRLSDGAVLWQRSVGEYDSLAASGDRLYVGSLEEAGAVPEQRLFALTSTGATLWQVDLSRADVSADVRPAVAPGLVLTTSVVGEVVAFDAATGARRWTQATNSGRMSSITIAGGVAYDLEDAVVHARRLTTGQQLWSAPAPDSAGAPVVAEGHIVVGGGTLRTFQLAG